MLAQSPPSSLFSTEPGSRKDLSIGMDLSPSRLVTHPTIPHAHDLHGLVDAQVHHPIGLTSQVLQLDQRLLLQSLASFNFPNPPFGVQISLQPQVHSNEFSASQNSSSSSGHAVNPQEILSSLPISDSMIDIGLKMPDDLTPPRSSSSSSGGFAQTANFSRQFDGFNGGSPKSAPAEALTFGRLNHAARQRTAQACEKCRDRKTKCSGTRPTCKRCSDRGLQCVWAAETRIRGSTRQPHQTRIESGNNMGGPLSTLPVPLSEPSSGDSSPLFHGRDSVQSAPAFQTTFPAIALPSHLLARYQQKRRSWNEDLIRTGGVSRGLDALSIMGEPIRPLTSFDDCWHSVKSATYEIPGRDRGTTIRARERRTTVSVAHLIRAKSLRDEAQEVTENEAPRLSGIFGDTSSVLHYSGESSNDSSQPSFGGGSHRASSSGTSESEPTLPHAAFQDSVHGERGLHQPFPSYDTGSQLSDEMIKLLNFPGAQNAQNYVIKDQDMLPMTHDNEAKPNAEEVFAQYFDADAFNSDKMEL